MTANLRHALPLSSSSLCMFNFSPSHKTKTIMEFHFGMPAVQVCSLQSLHLSLDSRFHSYLTQELSLSLVLPQEATLAFHTDHTL